MLLLLIDFEIGRKLKMEKIVLSLIHARKDPNSSHKIAEKSCEDLINQPQHIEKALSNYTSQQIADNRL